MGEDGAALSVGGGVSDARASRPLTFIVFGGNNPDILAETMSYRPWWRVEVVKTPTSVDNVIKRILPRADLVWKPTLYVRRPVAGKTPCTLHTVPSEWPGRLQLVNHFPEVKCLTSKTGLLRNMRRHYAATSRDVFDNLPSSCVTQRVMRCIHPSTAQTCSWIS